MSDNENARAHRLCGYCAQEYKQPNNKITCQGEVPTNQLIEGVNEHPVMILYLGFLWCLFPGHCSVTLGD